MGIDGHIHDLPLFPDTLEGIALSKLWDKEVDNVVTIVKDGPVADRLSFGVVGQKPQFVLHLFMNGGKQRLDMPFDVAFTDNKIVGNGRQSPHIERDDVKTLLIINFLTD